MVHQQDEIGTENQTLPSHPRDPPHSEGVVGQGRPLHQLGVPPVNGVDAEGLDSASVLGIPKPARPGGAMGNRVRALMQQAEHRLVVTADEWREREREGGLGLGF